MAENIAAQRLPAIRWPYYASPSLLIARLNEAFNTHGDIIRIRGIPLRLFCFRHPDHLREIYTHDEIGTAKLPRILPRVRSVMHHGSFIHPGGEDWKRRRKMCQPGFTRQSSLQIADRLPAIMDKWTAYWKRYADSGEPVDINREFGKLIIDITFTLLFSKIFTGQQLDDVHEDTNFLLQVFSDRDPLWLPTPKNRRFRQASHHIQRIMRGIIDDRLHGGGGHDVLAMLMGSEDTRLGRKWTVEEIQDEMLSIYFGATIVRVGLIWMFYLLSRHPAIRREAESELDKSLHGHAAATQDLETLRWPLMIFEEATRLYPPVWGFPRYAAKPVDIGGYRFPARSLLLPVGYLAHRHPAFWGNPEGFDPERFAPETRHKLHPFAYYPFGGGPRMCLGRNLAPLICQHVLAHIAQRYRLDFVPRFPDDPILNFSFELGTKTPMFMTFKQRE